MTPKQFTVGQIAEAIGATVEGNSERLITSYANLDASQEKDLSFFANPRYRNQFLATSAGAILVPLDCPPVAGKTLLRSSNPSESFQKAIELFYNPQDAVSGFSSIHPTAVIHETAQLEAGVVVGPYAVIDKECRIGKGTQIGAGVYLGPYVQIGEDCHLYPKVVVREFCHIGNRVIIQPGAILGACGFGYLTDGKGQHSKLQQVGTVHIEDDVEVGANSTVDRARFGTTRIKKGSKIHNLVIIAHNVQIGEHCMIAGQTGIAGSTEIGDYVWMGGQVGVNGHIRIASTTKIAAKSGVSKSIGPGTFGGIPALPIRLYNRLSALFRRLDRWFHNRQSTTD